GSGPRRARGRPLDRLARGRRKAPRAGERPMKPKPKVLFSEAQIAARLAELGPQIGAAYPDGELTVVGLMKSCLIFMADLVRRIPIDLSMHMVRVRSEREKEAGTARTEIVYTTSVPYEGRDILLLDDIVDTGITLNFLLD